MFVKESGFKRKLIDFFWKMFNYLENNGNTSFEKNGEKVFIKNLFKIFNNEPEKKNL